MNIKNLKKIFIDINKECKRSKESIVPFSDIVDKISNEFKEKRLKSKLLTMIHDSICVKMHKDEKKQVVSICMKKERNKMKTDNDKEIKVVHCKKEPYDIYIGRPSKWENPFSIGKDGTRKEVIEKYRKWIKTQPNLLKNLPELTGKILGCWCKPKACHGDVLKEIVENGNTL